MSLDFLSLINSEWFVNLGINQHLKRARAKVCMGLSALPKIDVEFDFELVVSILLKRLRDWISNTPRVNLALTGFFSAIAAARGSEATFLCLSDECPNGVYKVMASVCSVFTTRIGMRTGTIDEIQKGYQKFDIDPEGEESTMWCQIVILLEFLKELHSISQNKNLLRQRELAVLDR
jgi:hypothetical protein